MADGASDAERNPGGEPEAGGVWGPGLAFPCIPQHGAWVGWLHLQDSSLAVVPTKESTFKHESISVLYHLLNLEDLRWGLSLIKTICPGRSFPKYYIPVWLSKKTVDANGLYYCGGPYVNDLVWGKEV